MPIDELHVNQRANSLGDRVVPSLPFYTADVFTSARFGGNPLAVVIGGDTLDSMTMQAVAAEFNLSETTFVLPPAEPGHTARVRIFNRTAEMAFAGHPMIGTAFILAGLHPDLAEATFEIPAGLVHIRIERNADGEPVGAAVTTPQTLTLGEALEPEVIARVLRLAAGDVVTTTHPPMIASNGNPYVIAELTDDALVRCSPDVDAFRDALAAHPQEGGRFSVHVYCRHARTLRARMFAPLAGTWEDPATGSANAPLACLLLALDPGREAAVFTIHQGIEMGRPSLLRVEARRSADGIAATLHGSCVQVMQGELTL
ncbi:PhzF family phenazine biosynthesis protein [Sphingomonas sp. PL-96]|uniref:PhzF family phenazine biosynthesis protein n=1 Tax=Sphingomonas sp. PL-96 TaxID=2887201 RepID=UPI001E49E280|nr:PhzF family phenazine biosynthesis protein [Sphingomonas sp. PL-96]MCC2978464.1 PhzF family phenazine biosynthesis protein [Sphingomonas sp. PL-96]